MALLSRHPMYNSYLRHCPTITAPKNWTQNTLFDSCVRACANYPLLAKVAIKVGYSRVTLAVYNVQLFSLMVYDNSFHSPTVFTTNTNQFPLHHITVIIVLILFNFHNRDVIELNRETVAILTAGYSFTFCIFFLSTTVWNYNKRILAENKSD